MSIKHAWIMYTILQVFNMSTACDMSYIKLMV